MDIKELTELLVESSEKCNQTKYIPWWKTTFKEEENYYDKIICGTTLQDAEECLDKCTKEELLAPTGIYGLTLFHLLVWHNFYDAVEKMFGDGRIERDVVNLTDHKGYGLTPFLLACSRGNLAMVKLLLEHGADEYLCDKRGMNAYHFLAYPRFEDLAINFTCMENSVEQRGEIARLLNCDINKKNNDGLTPLEQLLSTSYSSGYTWTLTEVFLEKGAETGYMDEDGNTLLMMARRNGHITAALRLMEKCPELLNVANHRGVTPILHAIDYKNQAMYLALIDHGALPDPEQSMELFPISQIINNLFAHAADDNKDGLSIALYMTKKLLTQIDPDDDDELGEITDILHNALISDCDTLLLDTCKDAGIDFTIPIHYKSEVFCLRDKCLRWAYGIQVLRKMRELDVDMDKAVVKGRTPAVITASEDRKYSAEDEAFFEEAAKLFSKESMEQLDYHGTAAIHLAAKNGHTGMLKVMLEKGVDINLTQDEPADAGVTALHCACASGYSDAAALLLGYGADDTMQNLKGETPAHYAVMHKKSGESLKPEQRIALLKELKNLDIPREDGKTPFMMLQNISSAEEILTLFLDRGVNVNHRDNDGVTALMLYTDKDMAKELLRAGADIHMADNEGNTALHYALLEGSEQAARYLIKKGADYNRANNQGETPAQIAAEKGYEAVLELMVNL